MSDIVLWEYSVDEILKHDDRAGPSIVADVFSSVAGPSSICIELRFTWCAFRFSIHVGFLGGSASPWFHNMRLLVTLSVQIGVPF